jgi:hypothetical protein
MINLQVIDQYINRLSLKRLTKEGKIYTSECPICKEGKSAGKKKRFHVLVDNEKATCFCHNCGISTSFYNFIKEFYNSLFESFKKDSIMNGFFKYKTKLNSTYKNKEKEKHIKKDLLNNLTPVMKAPQEAINYCKKRKFDKKLIPNIYYTDNYMKFIHDNKLKQYKYIPKLDRRIVFPIFYKQNLCYLQGRSIVSNDWRYNNIQVQDGFKLFNYDNIDWNKQVILTEGIIECGYFLPNSGAMLNSSINLDIVKEYKNNIIVLLDNDIHTNIQVRKKALGFVDNGYAIVIFPNNIKEKDINEMVCNGWKKANILNLINNNIYKGIEAKVKLKIM